MVKTRLSEVITSWFTRIIFQPMRNGSNVFIMKQLRVLFLFFFFSFFRKPFLLPEATQRGKQSFYLNGKKKKSFETFKI